MQTSPDALPRHLDWLHLFSVLRSILRRSKHAASASDGSDYLLASGARRLLDDLRTTLSFVGIAQRRTTADNAIEELERVTDVLLSALELSPVHALHSGRIRSRR